MSVLPVDPSPLSASEPGDEPALPPDAGTGGGKVTNTIKFNSKCRGACDPAACHACQVCGGFDASASD